METLLGIEIKDEMDGIEDMRHLAQQKWEIRARELGIDIEKTIEGYTPDLTTLSVAG